MTKAKTTAKKLINSKTKEVGSPKQTADLVDALEKENSRLRRALKSVNKKPTIKVTKGKATKHELTVVIPDSHGEHIDIPARDAFIRDLAIIKPQTIVLLGDHIDAGGTFSNHQRSYSKELVESYDADVDAANVFFDMIQAASPNSRIHYIEGNHEAHVNRWAARNFSSYRDAARIVDLLGPEAVLRTKEREITYYRSDERYMGMAIPGTIKIGNCHYTHGISASKFATSVHLDRFGANVIHGHTHRSQSVISRTVTSEGIGGWCPGTLAKLQPLYRHTSPTSWSHGYGLVATNKSTGTFAVQLIPILYGESMLITDSLISGQ